MDAVSQGNILEGLNDAQREIVLHGPGPQLVVAGAGTGKTTVITRRIAHLVVSKTCLAKEILALTFTDKAAAEMESRVDLLVPYGFTDSTICTFHAFGDRLLREQGLLQGISPDFRVLNSAEQLVFLRERLFDLPLARLRPLADPTRNLELIAGVFSRAKDEDVRPAEYLAFCAREAEKAAAGDPAERARWAKQRELAEVYAKYVELMTGAGLADFGDLIVGSLALLRDHPDVLAECRRRWRYLLVDEFQDTNAAQFELVKLLAGPDPNLTVVGDDDQSIYKFRGAAISNILQFTETYPGAAIRVLTENHRSTQAVLDAAYRLIVHNNPDRLEVRHQINKRLVSTRGGGAAVRYRGFESGSLEADWIAGEILNRHESEGRPWSDFAVLVRTNRQADPFLRAFNLKGIPYRFSGNRGLYQRPEVRCCVAFLRAIADPAAPLPLHELAASEVYEFPAEDLALLAAAARRKHLPLLAVLQGALRGEAVTLSEAGKAAGERLAADLETYGAAARRLPTGQLLYRFLTESGLLARYTAAASPEGDFAVKNIAKFFQVIQRYEGIAKSDRVLYFVMHLDMLEDAGENPAVAEAEDDSPAATVTTVHRSKGLEYPVVYLAGMAGRRFPPDRRSPSLDLPDGLAKEWVPAGDTHLSEERRLCYVAMTRAKESLTLTSAKDYGGTRTYKVSPFVMEALELSKAELGPQGKTPALEVLKAMAPVPEPAGIPAGTADPERALSLSHYQIHDYLTCPLKYKYIHLLNIPFLPNHAILFGNALHTAVETFFLQRLKQGKVMTPDEVVRVFLNAWVNEGFVSREHEEMRQQAGIQAIHNLLEKETLTPSKPKYIEMPFQYTLGRDKLAGRMDRVDIDDAGQVTIIDFKSSEVADQAEADKRVADSLQLKIYASAWWHMHQTLPSSLELHFLENGLVGRAAFDLETIEKTDAQVAKVADQIRSGEYPAKPGAFTCTYCPYRTLCPQAEF